MTCFISSVTIRITYCILSLFCSGEKAKKKKPNTEHGRAKEWGRGRKCISLFTTIDCVRCRIRMWRVKRKNRRILMPYREGLFCTICKKCYVRRFDWRNISSSMSISVSFVNIIQQPYVFPCAHITGLDVFLLLFRYQFLCIISCTCPALVLFRSTFNWKI